MSTEIRGVIQQNPKLDMMIANIKGKGIKSAGLMREVSKEEALAKKEEKANEPITLNVNADEIVNNKYSDTRDNVTYNVEGVTFSNDEMKNLKNVMKNAISLMKTKGSDLDYNDYASMGIASNIVNSYAKQNLNVEQTQIASKSISNYISGVIKAQADWDKVDGNEKEFYAVKTVISKKAADDFGKNVSANSNISKSIQSTLMDNIAKATTEGSKTAMATNVRLANSIMDIFSKVDMNNENEISSAFDKYREKILPAYSEWGLSNTAYNNLLDNKINNDLSIFSRQISNAAALVANVKNINITV